MPWTLHILGGASESGRACFALDRGDQAVLLDCGVKRGVSGAQIGEYPLLSRPLIERLRTVLLTHLHEDHCAALPMLLAQGYKGQVLASAWTAARTPGAVNKWSQYVTKVGGQLPYTSSHLEALRLTSLPGSETGGEHHEGDLQIRWGRTGHIPGSLWFDLIWEGERCFYSGDWCPGSALLAADLPAAGDHTIAIIDAAYGMDNTSRTDCEEALWDACLGILKQGGRALLPMSASGRSQEWLTLLASRANVLGELGASVVVDQAILGGLIEYRASEDWLHADGLTTLKAFPAKMIKVRSPKNPWPADGQPALLIASDVMLATASGQEALAAIADDPASGVFLTGHQAPGTPGAELLAGRRTGLSCQVRFARLKVHPSLSDNLALLKRVQPRLVVLVHAVPERVSPLAEHLRGLGYDVVLPRPGDVVSIP